MRFHPRVTYFLLGVIAIVFIALELTGGSTSVPNLIKFGALTATRLHDGETWRLITPIFLHIGFLHIAFNGYALYQLGFICESLFGGIRFGAAFILCGIGGNLLSATLNSEAVSAGASGAIFGLAGLLLVAAFHNRQELINPEARSALLRGMLPFVAYNLIFGFVIPGIDNYCHLGGLVTGALLGLIILPGRRASPLWVIVGIAVSVATIWSAEQAYSNAKSMQTEKVQADLAFFLGLDSFVDEINKRVDNYNVQPNNIGVQLLNEINYVRSIAHKHFKQSELKDTDEQINKILIQMRAAMSSLLESHDEIGQRSSQQLFMNARIQYDEWRARMVAWAAKYGYDLNRISEK